MKTFAYSNRFNSVGGSPTNVKKMFLKNQKISLKDLVDFIPPKRFDSPKCSYIGFYQRNPNTGKLQRCKIMLNKYEPGLQRDNMAAAIIASVMNKVAKGWNRWIDNPAARSEIPVKNVIERYFTDIKKKADKGSHKQKTGYDYKSHATVFLRYLEDHNLYNIKMSQFNLALMTDFLDYLITERDLSAKTRNSYRTWLSHFCSWLVEREYLITNEVGKIKILKEKDKERRPLPDEHISRLREYLMKNDKDFLLACYFQYYEMIRPIELVQLRLRDIHIKEQTIVVPAAISKNRKTQVIALNDKVLKLMIELGFFRSPSHYYVFGKGMRPSEEKASSALFRNRWVKIAKKLNFPSSYKYYSLKDTGIIELANTEGIVYARDQARHSDISTTNKYTGGFSQTAAEKTKHFDGKL